MKEARLDGSITTNPVALWFETRGVAALLTMRVSDLILRSGAFAASRRMKPPNWRLRQSLARERV
jgi:hypothetical protein